MTVLLVGLGAFWCAEMIKTVLPWTLQPLAKLLVALTAAIVLSVLLNYDDLDWTILNALGGSGLAALAHRLHRLMGAVGDQQQVMVVMRARGQNRPRIGL